MKARKIVRGAAAGLLSISLLFSGLPVAAAESGYHTPLSVKKTERGSSKQRNRTRRENSRVRAAAGQERAERARIHPAARPGMRIIPRIRQREQKVPRIRRESRAAIIFPLAPWLWRRSNPSSRTMRLRVPRAERKLGPGIT